MIDFGSGEKLTVAECFDEENDELAFTTNGGIGFLKEHEVRLLHAFLGSLLESSCSKPQKRKIVQISACDLSTDVLCNDGSLWGVSQGVWTRMPDIPQDDEE